MGADTRLAVNDSGDGMVIRRFTSPDLFARMEATSNFGAGGEDDAGV